MTDFGFEVSKQPTGDYVYERAGSSPLLPLGEKTELKWKVTGADWEVSIPHADFPIISLPSKSAAVREMQEFIRQTQEALARLEALE